MFIKNEKNRRKKYLCDTVIKTTLCVKNVRSRDIKNRTHNDHHRKNLAFNTAQTDACTHTTTEREMKNINTTTIFYFFLLFFVVLCRKKIGLSSQHAPVSINTYAYTHTHIRSQFNLYGNH